MSRRPSSAKNKPAALVAESTTNADSTKLATTELPANEQAAVPDHSTGQAGNPTETATLQLQSQQPRNPNSARGRAHPVTSE
jgi:hypothetical protein